MSGYELIDDLNVPDDLLVVDRRVRDLQLHTNTDNGHAATTGTVVTTTPLYTNAECNRRYEYTDDDSGI
ncbi:hypothetical protein BG842_03285 [Haladaptatus sp. W1]|nr:hypothetical protein BG842_03285 [Haladaptatus sp. W1]